MEFQSSHFLDLFPLAGFNENYTSYTAGCCVLLPLGRIEPSWWNVLDDERTEPCPFHRFAGCEGTLGNLDRLIYAGSQRSDEK